MSVQSHRGIFTRIVRVLLASLAALLLMTALLFARGEFTDTHRGRLLESARNELFVAVPAG